MGERGWLGFVGSELRVGGLGLGTRGTLGLGSSTGSSDFLVVALALGFGLLADLAAAARFDAVVALAFDAAAAVGFLVLVVVAVAFFFVAGAAAAALVRVVAFGVGFSATVEARRGRFAVVSFSSAAARLRDGRVEVVDAGSALAAVRLGGMVRVGSTRFAREGKHYQTSTTK